MAAIDELTQSNLLPRRNPGLITRVARAIFRSDPAWGPQDQEQQQTKSGVVGDAGRREWFQNWFDTSLDRQSVYADVDEMDEQSEEASTALDIIADNATTSEDGQMESFEIYAPDTRIQQNLDDMVKRTKLHHKVYAIARNTVKYGDVFCEIVVNDELSIIDVRQLPVATMYRNEDNQGNFKLGVPKYATDGECLNKPEDCAFDQRDPQNQNVYAAFYPWQIVHWRWNHKGWSKYGRSYLRVLRVTWKKLHAAEEAMIIGRLVRAMLKLVFKVDTTGLSLAEKQKALSAFEQSIKQVNRQDSKRERPYNVLTDLFISTEHIRYGGQVVQSGAGVEAIDPKNSGLTQIDDIKHLQRKFIAGLRVPAAYYSIEEDINSRATVSMQDVQFVRFLHRLQQHVGHGIRQICDTSLVLAGIDPDTAEYEIKWPPLSIADEKAAAESLYREAQAYALMLGTNAQNQTPVIDRTYVQKHLLEMEDEDIEELGRRLDEAAAAQREADLAAGAKVTAIGVPPGGPPNGIKPEGTNEATIHNHTQRADPAKAANGANTAKRMRQEMRHAARLLVQESRQRLDPQLAAVEQGQARALDLSRELAVMFPERNGHSE